MNIVNEKARELLGEMYERLGTWSAVGEELAGENGNARAMGAIANRCYNGGSASVKLRKALGLYVPRHRRAIEFSSAEEAAKFDEWLKAQGCKTATDWFMNKVWDVY